MKNSFGVLLIPLLATLISQGCATFPEERGTWTGEGRPVTLYESDGKPVPALYLAIDPGLVKNAQVSDAPILVEKDMLLLAPSNYIGRRLQIKGLIKVAAPISPVDGKELNLLNPKQPVASNEWNWCPAYVIKVRQGSILDLGPSGTNEGI